MTVTVLVLVRHAHTSSNGGGRAVMSGWTDLPLSPTGVQQVERLRARAAHEEAPLAAVYTSPLVRAVDTAEALVTPATGEPRVVEDLREIFCGDVEGLGVEEVQRRFPSLWDANLRQDDDDFRWPGGESYRALRARVAGCVASLVRAHEGERIAAVTHAGVISQIMGSVRGVPPARWESFRPANTSMTELEFEGGSPRVVRYDDHAHLPR